MLDRLVGWAVFTVAHGVVSEHKKSGQLHQGRKAYRGAGIIAEDEKGRAEGSQLGERQSVDDGAHCMFTYAKMHVLAARTGGLKLACTLEGQGGFSRRAEIG